MLTIDEAIAFLIDFVKKPRKSSYGSYGYDVYLPNVVRSFVQESEGRHTPDFLNETKERALSPIFYDAAWDLCRRGVFRQGVAEFGGQGSGDGSGYSLTAAGRRWLAQASDVDFIAMQPGRFGQIIEKFRHRFGEGYFQRAQEAAKCHAACAYLASCAMSGAAAESILLALAIAKNGEKSVLGLYRTANGRAKVENGIVGKLGDPLATRFRNAMELLKYWRDDAAHGIASDIEEFEAYDAMSRLLRLAHLANDHWDEFTVRS